MNHYDSKAEHRFDWEVAFVLVTANALIVFFINQDGHGGGLQAGFIQAFLTFLASGWVMPRVRRAACSPSKAQAYVVGAVILPLGALGVAHTVHWLSGTPNLFGTTIFLIFSTIISGTLFVIAKRNQTFLPGRIIKKIVARI